MIGVEDAGETVRVRYEMETGAIRFDHLASGRLVEHVGYAQ